MYICRKMKSMFLIGSWTLKGLTVVWELTHSCGQKYTLLLTTSFCVHCITSWLYSTSVGLAFMMLANDEYGVSNI